MKRLKTVLLTLTLFGMADASLYLTVRLAVADGVIDAAERVVESSTTQTREMVVIGDPVIVTDS